MFCFWKSIWILTYGIKIFGWKLRTKFLYQFFHCVDVSLKDDYAPSLTWWDKYCGFLTFNRKTRWIIYIYMKTHSAPWTLTRTYWHGVEFLQSLSFFSKVPRSTWSCPWSCTWLSCTGQGGEDRWAAHSHKWGWWCKVERHAGERGKE